MAGSSVNTPTERHGVFEELSFILGGVVASDSYILDETAKEKWFRLFIKILLGKISKAYAPPSRAVNGEQLVIPTPVFWLPHYLEKMIGKPDIDHLQSLRMVKEVMRHENKTNVMLVFAQMPLDHVEHLLQHPEEDLRSTLNGVAAELERQKRAAAQRVAAKGERQGRK